ncbi:MAG TPA: DUF4446 family protein [Thermoleophilaceae bacterium]|nr:DUF4446 family protein [Thermoleophilaceae bacterium]
MDELSSPEGIVAVAAAGLALVALLLAGSLFVKLRRLRHAQRAVLGEAGQRDLVAHASRLEQGFLELREWVEETATAIESRMAQAEGRIDGCVTYRSVVRYDAYGEMSGQQSSSIALLDATHSGLVLSSILHRENARVYVKQVTAGASEQQLSPEEEEAIAAALSAQQGAAAGA